uniref:F-box domain-containing protein n=1 Tax=Mycena chlorophos TaxID=658473 RepID=A0ABQ0M5T7_MYCCL|nr:predicted protein [Mycena chlorophos]
MHPALSILEIREGICSCFSPATSREDRRTLWAIALTTSALSDPALDTLWSEQTSLEPLIMCFPRDLFTIRPGLSKKREIRVTVARPIVESDWTRPLIYTRRVRSVRFERTTGVNMDILFTFALSMPTNALFPRLQRFSFVNPDFASFQHIRPLFLTASLPQLTTLGLDLRDTDLGGPAALSLLSSLSTRRFPALSQVRMQTAWTESEPIDALGARAVSDFVCSLPEALRALSVTCLDRPALAYICGLPLLSTLEMLTLGGADGSGEALPLPVGPGFAGMRKLVLKSTKTEPFINLVSSIYGAPLEILDVTFAEALTASTLNQFAGILARNGAHWALRSINLQMKGAVEAQPFGPFSPQLSAHPNETLVVDNVRPLFACRHLTDLAIRVDHPIALSDEDVEELTLAFPNLHTLSLTSSVRPSCGPTLQLLCALARNCRHLRVAEIHVLVDTEDIPPSLAGYTGLNLTEFPQQRALKELRTFFAAVPRALQEDTVMTPRDRFQRLSRILFPKLTALRFL